MATNDLREYLNRRLRDLLDQWNVLQDNPSASSRDYARMRAQITDVCAELDALDR